MRRALGAAASAADGSAGRERAQHLGGSGRKHQEGVDVTKLEIRKIAEGREVDEHRGDERFGWQDGMQSVCRRGETQPPESLPKRRERQINEKRPVVRPL